MAGEPVSGVAGALVAWAQLGRVASGKNGFWVCSFFKDLFIRKGEKAPVEQG